MTVFANEDYPLVTLRVDDHPDPILELRRVLEVWKTEEQPWLSFMPTRNDPIPGWQQVTRFRDQMEDELNELEPVKEF
jgi:uncharacterized Ntn-hydrolase superfamily protein